MRVNCIDNIVLFENTIFEVTVTFSSRIKDALMFLIDIIQLSRIIIITFIYNISQLQEFERKWLGNV